MFYKPNYCCNCGEKIERANPSVTDSRRFCDVCKHDFVLHRSLPLVFVALTTIFGILGIGSYWRSGEKTPFPANRQLSANPSDAGKKTVNNTSQISSNSNAPPAATVVANGQVNAAAPPILTNKPPPRQTAPVPTLTNETVYFCGAPTKKGTPCSRRVRGGGRCWQHTGLEALLPPEKLIVNR